MKFFFRKKIANHRIKKKRRKNLAIEGEENFEREIHKYSKNEYQQENILPNKQFRPGKFNMFSYPIYCKSPINIYIYRYISQQTKIKEKIKFM